ncbi:MAG: Signal recognition particle receptor protein FtsY (alpha subunit), partial [uncultured Chloroflexia bacterium]
MHTTMLHRLIGFLLLPILAACSTAGVATTPPDTSAAATAHSVATANRRPGRIEMENASVTASVAATTPAPPQTTAADATSGSDIRIALVTSGGRVDDGGIEQLVYEGL